MSEPELNVNNIQGNIVPGFNKDYQAFLFLKIEDEKIEDGKEKGYDFRNFRHWLEELAPRITTMESVLVFRSLLKEEEWRGKPTEAPPKVKTTWISIAFSHAAFRDLVNKGKDIDFKDKAFTAGLHKQSPCLGDPTGEGDEGNPKNWVVGGEDNEADVIVIVASDDRLDLFDEVNRIENSLYVSQTTDETKPGRSSVRIIFKQYGANLPGSREHFGYRDGISQPGVRGRIPKKLERYLTDGYLTPRRQSSRDESRELGQDLVWPGKFVFGYPDQDGNADDVLPLARDGSFLVFRRLRQDVGAFHTFLRDNADDPGLLGAKFVGRWPSGTPILHDPEGEKAKAAMAQDDLINNDFTFKGKDDAVCPFASHIRKVNPRDDESRAQTPRLLRRGIPYGDPSWSLPTMPYEDKIDRGLLFLSYQTSIENQFEFLQKQANGSKDKGMEPDPIIGQHTEQGTRKRQFTVTLRNKRKTVCIEKDWVIPTGGGYFFAPSIEALRMLASPLQEIRDAYFLNAQSIKASAKTTQSGEEPPTEAHIMWLNTQDKMPRNNLGTADTEGESKKIELRERALIWEHARSNLKLKFKAMLKDKQNETIEKLQQLKETRKQNPAKTFEELLRDVKDFQPKAITTEEWAQIWAHAWLNPEFREILKKNPATAVREFQEFQRQATPVLFHSLQEHDKFFDVVGNIYEKSFGRGPFMNLSFQDLSIEELAEIAAKATLRGNPFCMQQNEWVSLE